MSSLYSSKMNTYKVVKPIMVFLTKLHRLLFNKFGLRSLGSLLGNPICIITTVGRKSGNPIVIPLLTIPHEDNYILVASHGGAPNNPAWVYNLIHEPRIKMTVKSKTYNMLAKKLSDEEKENLWPVIIKAGPFYDEYQKKITRNIPVFLCSKE
ncbi:MAG TPA: nitroreductase family deazaflavin-dependent oxidoreductase [Gammaproteobacteria bacterium]|jgi:deazaflavin-dependent oxidoreductase (nitroreductase family)|nr:nitroreductase family deazaflavin-dependent oxidoreductase [Gammaproteobacteria bacterium]